MRRVGIIIALVCGVLGFMLAAITLAIGGFGDLFDIKVASKAIIIGQLGIVCALFVILFSALALRIENKLLLIALGLSAAIGALFGGVLFYLLMTLAWICTMSVWLSNPHHRVIKRSILQKIWTFVWRFSVIAISVIVIFVLRVSYTQPIT